MQWQEGTTSIIYNKQTNVFSSLNALLARSSLNFSSVQLCVLKNPSARKPNIEFNKDSEH